MGDTGDSGVIGFIVIVGIFACTFAFLIAFLLVFLFRTKKGFNFILVIIAVLGLPLLFISAKLAYQLMRGSIDQTKQEANLRPIVWVYKNEELNSVINKFYIEHSSSFTFPPNSEEAYSPELLKYLSSNDIFSKSGFTIKEQSIISPFGDTILFAIDRNNDGLIEASNCVLFTPWEDRRYACVLVRHTTTREGPHQDWERRN
jgi:hypothetical protein